jgi:hypothetical protein
VAQQVPPFDFTPSAKAVRAFLYRYFCEYGSAPDLRRIHGATQLPRRVILDALDELELGLMVVCDEAAETRPILRVPPFSSYRTGYDIIVDGRPLGFAGCAMESTAISRLPAMAGRRVTIEASCGCCLAPITLTMTDAEVLDVTPQTTVLHISSHPRTWANPGLTGMCDTMRFVVDASHAEEVERLLGARGVTLTIEQACGFTGPTAAIRMHDLSAPPDRIVVPLIFDKLRDLGVDISVWTLRADHEPRHE